MSATEFPEKGNDHYVVSWDIDIWATSPREAAKLGWKIRQNPGKSSIIHVKKYPDGETRAFDFEEPLELE